MVFKGHADTLSFDPYNLPKGLAEQILQCNFYR